MQIEPAILSRHLHDAAVEQLAAEYRDRGYVAETEVMLGEFRADLVTRKGSEMIVFEVKAGQSSARTSAEVSRMMEYVGRELGGRFRLVLVGVPQPVEVEIERVETILLDLAQNPVGDQLAGEASHFHSLDVEDVEYDLVRIRDEQVEVRGRALLSLVLQYGSDGDIRRDDGMERDASYSIRFDLVLDLDMNLSEATEFKIEREPS
jgi:hypothetical protein